MYIHPKNIWTKEADLIEFIQQNAFATLVSRVTNRPWATHLPLILDKDQDDHPILLGHLAKANPQWKEIENEEVLAIFQGPHAYISSSWYNHENVPTWNYQAIHVYGTCRIIEGEHLMHHLKTIVDKYEDGRPNRVSVEKMSDSYVQGQVKALVGIEIKVSEVQASAKLSQNRDQVNFKNIILKLQESPFPMDHQVASEMEKILNANGEG